MVLNTAQLSMGTILKYFSYPLEKCSYFIQMMGHAEVNNVHDGFSSTFCSLFFLFFFFFLVLILNNTKSKLMILWVAVSGRLDIQ